MTTYRKKTYRKKRTYNKKKTNYNNKTRIGRPSKGLKQSVYLFKRRVVDVIELNTQSPPPDWEAGAFNSLYTQQEFKLSDLREQTDFASLFLQYKITGVKTTFMFSQTTAGPVHHETSPQTTNSNAQVIVMYAPWMSGASTDPDANYMKDTQASKRRLGLNGGKPISLYTKCKQLSVLYRAGLAPAATFDYGSTKPKWISTQEQDTPHYGLNICFQRADRDLFANDSTNYQKCRIEHTYYVACKGVH